MYDALQSLATLEKVVTDIDLAPHPIAALLSNHYHKTTSTTLLNELKNATEAYRRDELTGNRDAVSMFHAKVYRLIRQASILYQHKKNTEEFPFLKNQTSLRWSLWGGAFPKKIEDNKKREIKAILNDISSNSLTGTLVKRKEVLKRGGVSLMDSQAKWTNTEGLWEDPEQTYHAYVNYLEKGSRHNELVSRVYPWEIGGIEIGSGPYRKNAFITLHITQNYRNLLAQEFENQGINHSLFVDFMLNKISVENTQLDYAGVRKAFEAYTQNADTLANLNKIKDDIIAELKRPIYVYEYSVVKRAIVNLSTLISESLEQSHESRIKYTKNKQFQEILSEPIDVYINAFHQGNKAYHEFLKPPSRNWSFYLLWLSTVVFAALAILSFCFAMNLVLASTFGLGPTAMLLGTVLLGKITPTSLSFYYASVGLSSSLVASLSLFKISSHCPENKSLSDFKQSMNP